MYTHTYSHIYTHIHPYTHTHKHIHTYITHIHTDTHFLIYVTITPSNTLSSMEVLRQMLYIYRHYSYKTYNATLLKNNS